jgi:hypothetical protein
MGPIDCLYLSTVNYHTMLRKTPEERLSEIKKTRNFRLVQLQNLYKMRTEINTFLEQLF